MEFTATEAWSLILERARALLPDQTYRTWLAKTEPLALSEDLLEVGAGSEFAAEWIEDKYGKLLAELAERALGRRIAITVRHQVPPDGPVRPAANGALPPLAAGAAGAVGMPGSPAPGSAPGGPAGGEGLLRAEAAPVPVAPSPPAVRLTSPASAATPGGPLNERYTFDRFVVGTNNQLAAAACRAVSEAPARMYNPLFIYGGVGLGKTHLMHAIGHAILARDPGKRVAYLSSERFTNEMVVSIQEGRMPEFRRRYRDIDLLLIDDIHFLGEKERTQEEFFHTFNALHDAQRQIVLTSDRPPKEINGLELRLVSRFEWGLVTDIKAPDLETREAILRKKAEDDRLILADEVLQFIARNCRSNVRELEGAIIKLLAYSSLTRREITVELAREALGGVLAVPAAMEVTPEAIRARVAGSFGVSVDALCSKKRTKELTVPRQIAMYLIRVMLDLPLVEVGKLFGGRDHSTVIHSVTKVEEDLRNDEQLRARVEALKQELAG